MCARVAADLREAIADRHRVDPAAAFEQLLLGHRALGRDEDLVLPLRAYEGRGHLHVLVLQCTFSP